MKKSISVFILILIAFMLYSQDRNYECKFLKGISFGEESKNYVITNNGDNEHEYFTIKFESQNSKKYDISVIPGMFLIIQKDDPSIDVLNVLEFYMKDFIDNLQATGVKPEKKPEKLKGYQDQVRTVYTFKNKDIVLLGDLFVGKDSGLLYIAYSSSTDDLYSSTTYKFSQILNNFQVVY